jgi:hypothetical protein
MLAEDLKGPMAKADNGTNDRAEMPPASSCGRLGISPCHFPDYIYLTPSAESRRERA